MKEKIKKIIVVMALIGGVAYAINMICTFVEGAIIGAKFVLNGVKNNDIQIGGGARNSQNEQNNKDDAKDVKAFKTGFCA